MISRGTGCPPWRSSAYPPFEGPTKTTSPREPMWSRVPWLGRQLALAAEDEPARVLASRKVRDWIIDSGRGPNGLL